ASMDPIPESPEPSGREVEPPLARKLTEVERSWLLTSGALLAFALAFGFALSQFDVMSEPGERDFGAAAGDAQIEVYIQPTQIDPLNYSMQFRLSTQPKRSNGEMVNAVADRDLVLTVKRGNETDNVQIRLNQPYPELNLATDLDGGGVRYYPLDRYAAEISMALVDPSQVQPGKSLPFHVKTWEGVLGWQVQAQPLALRDPGAVGVRLLAQRTGATAFFGLALYGAMVVMAVCAMAIGTLVFVGIRRIEVTLIGAVGAMVFALPALRNAMPGNPPVGVRGDVFVFFWAELATVTALSMFVIAWARRGTKP
ncbi:MAG: DUF4436 family protein, partial [Gammaproteobacteria bacterium]